MSRMHGSLFFMVVFGIAGAPAMATETSTEAVVAAKALSHSSKGYAIPNDPIPETDAQKSDRNAQHEPKVIASSDRAAKPSAILADFLTAGQNSFS